MFITGLPHGQEKSGNQEKSGKKENWQKSGKNGGFLKKVRKKSGKKLKKP